MICRQICLILSVFLVFSACKQDEPADQILTEPLKVGQTTGPGVGHRILNTKDNTLSSTNIDLNGDGRHDLILHHALSSCPGWTNHPPHSEQYKYLTYDTTRIEFYETAAGNIFHPINSIVDNLHRVNHMAQRNSQAPSRNFLISSWVKIDTVNSYTSIFNNQPAPYYLVYKILGTPMETVGWLKLEGPGNMESILLAETAFKGVTK